MGKRRSRSRSRDSKRRKDEKFDRIQMQIDNLTKVVEALVNRQGEKPLTNTKKNQEIEVVTLGKPE